MESKAWYIQQFKDEPDQRGINFLTNAPGLYFTKVVKAVSELEDAGYLRNEAPPDRQANYFVSSFGHRYLAEHQDELRAPLMAQRQTLIKAEDHTAIDVGQREKHAVPDTPKPKFMFETERTEPKAALHITPPKPATPDRPPLPRIAQIPKVFVGSEKGMKVERPDQDPPVWTGDGARNPVEKPTVDVPTFASELRSVLAEIMIPRFAAQITADDILKHLDKK